MKSNHHHPRTSAAGFSLAELMVVIVIIGLLATLVVPSVLSRLSKANVGIAKTDITTISQGITEYQIQNNGRLPDSLEDLVTEDSSGDKILDRDTVPKDPWGNEYVFEQNGRDFTVMSYGADGEPGGDEKDRDIDNHMIKNGEI